MSSTILDPAQERLHLVARAVTDVVYDYSFLTDDLWLADSFYDSFGHRGEPGIATGLQWQALVHPDEIVGVLASLKTAVGSDRDSWEAEYRLRREDGSYATVLDRGGLMRDHGGRALRLIGGIVDLTEQRKASTDLRLLMRAVEISDNSIIIADATDPALPIIYTNPAFTRITGYTREDVLGQNCRFLQGRDRDQPGILELRAALAEGRDAHVMLRNYRKNGEAFWNDFTLTPLRDEHARLTHYLGVSTDATLRHRYEEQLAHRASHDPLTNLPNRQLAFDRLAELMRDAQRDGLGIVVLFIDLDDFKLVNDALGHAAGDQILMAVAERLSAAIDHTMTIARFGGDEFVLIAAQNPQAPDHPELIARIIAAVSRPIDVDAIQHTITPSIGYALYPDDGDTPDTLLMHADTAMYQAKRQGRNRAVRFEPQFNEIVSQRLQLVSRLRLALDRREFRLAFQPVFDCDGRAVALEALVRWQHPERGLLLPGEFIGVCEDSGLIVELGRRVLAEAARHHALLAERGHGHLRIAVNVSAAQFADDLYAHVVDAIEQYQMPPYLLELEITESTVMTSPERAIRTLHRLADLGIGIAIDDFGTGYSSLAYLKQLPINRLKIDRSFVRDLEMDANDRSICSAIVAMARSMGLHTTAEGVETAEQRDWLCAHDIDELQGYLLARPAGFEDTLERLATAGASPFASI